MKTKHIILTTLVFLALMLAACGSEGDPLEGTSWRLQSINGMPVLQGTSPTITFADGAVSGSGGCNSYGGSYLANGENLSTDALFMTEMACMTDGVMVQETAFLRLLGGAERYELEGGLLTIFNSGGGALVFAAVVE